MNFHCHATNISYDVNLRNMAYLSIADMKLFVLYSEFFLQRFHCVRLALN